MEILIYLFIFSKYVAELNKRQKIHTLYKLFCLFAYIVSECVFQHFSLCFIKIFLCTAFFFINKYQLLICYAIPFSL